MRSMTQSADDIDTAAFGAEALGFSAQPVARAAWNRPTWRKLNSSHAETGVNSIADVNATLS
jgi:hypothetical protein